MDTMLYQLITFLHLIGFALGFGGAMVSDYIFFSSIKDRKITKTEFRFMRLGGTLVWIGLLILFLSGVGLVFLNPSLLSSSKFLIKMVVVAVIAINGIVFHAMHIPHLRDHIGIFFHDSESFQKRSHYLTVSGGISFVSWFSAALLGSLPEVPYTFFVLLCLYLLILCSAIIGGLVMNAIIFKKK